MTEPMHCSCGRSIPIHAAWKGLTLDKPLRCSECGEEKDRLSLLPLVDDDTADDRVRAALIAWLLIDKYGWCSSSTISNLANLDAQKIGGVLAGLVRSGLLQRAEGKPSAAAAIADPHPIFIPGPQHPVVA
jgi:hypothetical protein